MKAPCCLLGAGALPRPPEARQGSGRADRCPGVPRGSCIYLWCVMWWVIVVVAAAAAGADPDCAVRTDAEDVASKAYVSPQVVEGVVQQVNRSLPGTPYTATILVTKKLRPYSGPGRVKKRDIVNLTFLPSPTSDPSGGSSHSDLCLVTADLRYRRKYLFFLSGGGNSRGAAPQSVAPPDPASKKLRRLVRKTVCKKCGEAPKVSGLLEDSVVENYNLTLECSVEGNPLPDVQWFKDDLPLHNSRKIRIRSRVKKLRRWKARYNRDVTSTAEEAGRQQLFRRRLRARRAEVERRLDQLNGRQADGDLPGGETAPVVAVGRRNAEEGGVGRSQGGARSSRLRRKRQGGGGEAGRRRIGGQGGRRRARGSTRRQARDEAKGRRLAKTQEATEERRPETTTESTQTRRTRGRRPRAGGETRRTGTRSEQTRPEEGETRKTGRRRHERARDEEEGTRRTGGARRTQRERQTEGQARRTGTKRNERARKQRQQQQQQEDEEETTTGGEATTTRRKLGRRGRHQGSREQRRRNTTANPTGGFRRRNNQSRLNGSNNNNNSSNASVGESGTGSRSRRGRGRGPNSQKRVLVSYLVIRNIVASDAGRYKCVAKSVAGQDQAEAIIRVVPPIDPHPYVDKCPYDGYCLNGGTCMMFKIVGELVCQCVEGFKGQRCTEKEVYPTFNLNCHGPMRNNGHSQGRRCPRNQPAALWELLQQTLARRHKVSPWTKTQLLSWSPSHTGSAALWPHPHPTTPYPTLPDSLSTLNPRLIEYLFPDHDFSEVTRRKGPLMSPWPTSPSDPESQSSLVPHHLPDPPQPSLHHSLTQHAQEEGSSNSDDSSAFNTSLHLPRPPPGQSHSSNPAASRHYTTTTTHRHRHRHHLRAPVSLNATSDGVLSATQSPGQSQPRWRSEVLPTNLSPPPHYDPPHHQ